MSPFAIALRKFRKNRGLKQNILAALLGYEASYLSALERSEKGPPRQDFIRRLIQGLKLDASEQEELLNALEASRRHVTLPARASEGEYALLRRLRPQLGRLHPLQVQLIQLILDIPQILADRSLHAEAAVRPLIRKEEPRM